MLKKALLFVLVFAFMFSFAYAKEHKNVIKPLNDVPQNVEKGQRIKYNALQPAVAESPVELTVPKGGPFKVQASANDPAPVDGMHTIIEELEYPGYDFRWRILANSWKI